MRFLSLVKNKSAPAVAAQARWMTSAEETPILSLRFAYKSAVSNV